MADYMTLHASAYPPTHWAFLANRQSKAPQTSNELWIEMTDQYELSMAKRQHAMTSNYLSETATDANIRLMRPDAQELYRKPVTIAFEDAANIGDLLDIKDQFVKAMDGLARNPIKAIPEEDELGTTHSLRQTTEKEALQNKQAILNANHYQQLLDSDEIKMTFRTRLMEIYSICHEFICTLPGTHPRPRWAQVCRLDKEVIAHVAHTAHIQQQSTSDVAELRDFLRGQLFDEYCLMRDTPKEEKNETWLRYGRCLSPANKIGKRDKSSIRTTAENLDLGDRETERRLDRMIDASGLDPDWIMGHIENYFAGNDHIGKWQSYVQGCHWKRLAAKFVKDAQQLQKINSTIKSSNSRPCKIMISIHNIKRQFFTRLDGAQDFKLSERALR